MADLVTTVDERGGCPSCGQGLGQPHYERCAIPVPEYDRILLGREIHGLTAYAIGVFPLDIVRRSTVRAMLPRGQTYGHRTSAQRRVSATTSVNAVTKAFQATLRQCGQRGWIDRRDDCVVILIRDRLLSYARGQLRYSPGLIPALYESLSAVAAGLPQELTAAGRAQRSAELRAIQRLMEQTPATGPHSGRGYVRLTSKPGMLP